jgi:hypothetical protein
MRHAIDADPTISKVPLVSDADVAAPENAYFFSVVRLIDANGAKQEHFGMPKVPTDFFFKQDDVARIQTWIRNGAMND